MKKILALFDTHIPFNIRLDPVFEFAHDFKPDIVISDYRMPVMNGFELFLNIRRVDKDAKVILMSAVVDLDPFVLTKDSSAYEFIEKPLNLALLLEYMQKE